MPMRTRTAILRIRTVTGRSRPRTRTATATVAILIVLVGLQLAIGLSVLGGARDQDLGVQRISTVRAFYAAEAGMNMAIRELMTDTDEDGDKTVGSISNDDNSTNDPQLGQARVFVLKDVSTQTTLTSRGTAGTTQREVQAVLTP